MNKTILFIIFLLTLPIVTGGVIVEYSTDNATWENVTSVTTTDGTAYSVNLEEGTLYYFRAKNDSSSWIYFTQRTDTSGEKGMSSLAVTGFALLISVGMFLLPWFIKNFSKNYYLDTTLKGLSICIGLFLLSLTTSMMATLSSTFALGLEDEIFLFLFLINWAAYLSIVGVILFFGYKMLQMWIQTKENRRWGSDDEN